MIFFIMNLILFYILESNGQLTTHHIFSQIVKKNVRFFDIPTAEQFVRSVIDCARLCQKSQDCKSVNLIRMGKKKMCQLFKTKPLDPRTLDHDINSQYWERTCQPSFAITAATSDNITLQIKIVADFGRNIYHLNFNDDFTQNNLHFNDSVLKATNGKHLMISNAVTMKSQHSPSISLKENGTGWTFCDIDTTPCTVPGSWPKHFEELTGGFSTWALTSNRDGDGFYVFSNERVIEISTPIGPEWEVVETYNINENVADNLWRNIPRGIIAASWIPQYGPERKVFLATRDYYVVFDITSNAVLQRDHLCSP
ncbi:uncharacterized protein LOC126818476 [Patella vulgata]|uniref:uncharacterized protein LOC126818476 n=1 Tax=Patella vulgata TaxID=6465 RepID=UPI00217F4AEC|nr:uncharacterized protein LOC126818476 [Patella vulgata]